MKTHVISGFNDHLLEITRREGMVYIYTNGRTLGFDLAMAEQIQTGLMMVTGDDPPVDRAISHGMDEYQKAHAPQREPQPAPVPSLEDL